VTDFPLDDATLVMLAAACEINPDSGHTELHAFLDMGTRIKTQTLVDEGDPDIGGMPGAPVYEVEYEAGFAPFSENDAIRALVAEIQRLRAANSQLHDPACASHERLPDPGPEGEGTFDERGWYHPPCDCKGPAA
jgi:hypothetical protein